ncbi:hypothetical protein [Spirosoma gilvum]
MNPLPSLLLLGLLACHRSAPDPPTSEPLSIAPPSYLILAQRALTAQADLDTATLDQLLADSIRIEHPNGSSERQAKARLLASWQEELRKTGVLRMRLSDLTHLPIRSRHPLALTGQAGVYVVSYCQATLLYRDGHTARQILHNCYHFDTRQHIDYILFSPNL